VVQAGKDVLVEQLSTITLDGDHHVSMVCHIFTVEDGRIQQLRTYRNDHGLPIG
jgi:limonene-1,2-epoxide hydrolase